MTHPFGMARFAIGCVSAVLAVLLAYGIFFAFILAMIWARWAGFEIVRGRPDDPAAAGHAFLSAGIVMAIVSLFLLWRGINGSLTRLFLTRHGEEPSRESPP